MVCLVAYPGGATFDICPQYLTTGCIHVTTDATIADIFRGLYTYRVSLDGYQTVAYPLLVNSRLRRPARLPLRAIARPLAVMLLTFGGAAYLGERVHARHWLDWAVGVAVTFALQLAVAFAAGLPPEARRGVLGRWRAMVATTRG